jgi:hypothetical protein
LNLQAATMKTSHRCVGAVTDAPASAPTTGLGRAVISLSPFVHLPELLVFLNPFGQCKTHRSTLVAPKRPHAHGVNPFGSTGMISAASPFGSRKRTGMAWSCFTLLFDFEGI